MSEFTHLHVHTEYSILDGLAKIPELIKKSYDDGMRAMAITDHGNMFGVFSFVKEVSKFNSKLPAEEEPFKAIIGCEMYVARKSRFSKNSKEDRSGHHLILLAKNMKGYTNLSKLSSYAYSEGLYYTPRIDKELLKQYSEGIIACSACLGGELAQVIMRDNHSAHQGEIQGSLQLTEASKIVEEFKSIFGDDYYLELQRNGHSEQYLVNEALIKLSAQHNVKCIATNDVHFVNQDDYEAHKMLICINTRRNFYSSEGAMQDEDADNGFAYSGQEYLRTTSEMKELFADYPDAITNTQELASKIESIKISRPVELPKFEVPSEYEDEISYLSYLTWEGAKKRYSEITEEIKERIEFEINVVKTMGFPGYFLIVWDLINAGKQMGVRFGPGRGSAAGSILCYCIGITNIDPIKYGLLFERFLNPDRISMPDIDIDIEDSGRDKVLQYVIDKYGIEKVAQIVTFNTMAAKSSIRDCARVLNLSLDESDKLAKLIPTKLPSKKDKDKNKNNANEDAEKIVVDSGDSALVTIEKAIKLVPELQNELTKGSDLVKKTIQFAQKLEGTVRSNGVHACGVIIGRDNLYNLIPLHTSKTTNTLVTQYEGIFVEEAGLLKMDFLGLKTLNIISSTLENIKKRHGIDIDIDNISLNDSKTYQIFSTGDTTAVFQFESEGMRKSLQELKPENIEDIIAMVSLYRPGPMDKIPIYINRKHGKEKIKYTIPIMSKYLDETYGITVYQEQVMLISRQLANFTRGQSDHLRKAMGKKKEKEMNELEESFYKGGMENGHNVEFLKEIWSDWKKFAEYAFNKSHATCYAFVAYQTAYLKANYPAEFMAANLTNNLDNLEKVTSLIEDTNRMGIKILNPDINESELTFTVNKKGNIRFGLGALKGVGASAVESIIEERVKNGNFVNIFDFIKRINLRNCNKRALESLAYAGAFDGFKEMHRAQFFHDDGDGHSFLEKIITYGNKAQSSVNHAQFTIFDDAPELSNVCDPLIPECTPWNPIVQLKHEKEIAGFYISGHPLDDYKTIIDNYTNSTLEDLKDPGNYKKYIGKNICFVGLVTESQQSITKNNKEYGKITIEDHFNSFQWMLFGESYTKYKHLFEPGKQLFFKAKVKERYYGGDIQGEKQYELYPFEIFYLHDAFDKLCKQITLTLQVNDLSPNIAFLLKEIIDKSKGKKPLYIRVVSDDKEFHLDFFASEIKINPEHFIKNFNLQIPNKIVLE